MKLFCCILIALLYTFTSFGQTRREANLAFQNHEYEQALAMSGSMINSHPSDPFPYALAGWIFAKEMKLDSATAMLTKAIQLDNDSSYLSAVSHVNLGSVYLFSNNRRKGIEEIKRGITVGLAPARLKEAIHILDSVDYEMPGKEYPKNYLPDWVVIQGANVTYKFQDTIGITSAVYMFVNTCERQYAQLNEIFNAKPPSKIILHVWNDVVIGEKIVHQYPAFISGSQCFAHIPRTEPQGYVLASMLNYWSGGKANTGWNNFIGKGIGVAFNLDERDNLADGRWSLQQYKVSDIMDVWEHEKKYAKQSYYIAGAFVTYLYQNTPRDKFLQAMKIQTIEGIKNIYGDQFDKIITGFNQTMGLK